MKAEYWFLLFITLVILLAGFFIALPIIIIFIGLFFGLLGLITSMGTESGQFLISIAVLIWKYWYATLGAALIITIIFVILTKKVNE